MLCRVHASESPFVQESIVTDPSNITIRIAHISVVVITLELVIFLLVKMLCSSIFQNVNIVILVIDLLRQTIS